MATSYVAPAMLYINNMKYTFKDLKKAQLQASRMNNKVYDIEQQLINQSPLKIGDTVKVLSNVIPYPSLKSKLGTPIIGKQSKIEDISLSGDNYSYTLGWRDKQGMRWCFTANELKFIRKSK